MRTPVSAPCQTCGHSRGKHVGDGPCSRGWTYLHYAEQRCTCVEYVPRAEPEPPPAPDARGGEST